MVAKTVMVYSRQVIMTGHLISKMQSMVVSAVDSMDHHFKTAAGRSKLQELEAKIEEGEKVRPQVLELLKNGKFDEAYDLNYSTYLPIIDEIKALTEEIETLCKKQWTAGVCLFREIKHCNDCYRRGIAYHSCLNCNLPDKSSDRDSDPAGKRDGRSF